MHQDIAKSQYPGEVISFTTYSYTKNRHVWMSLAIGHMLKTWTFDLPLNSRDPPHPRLSPVWHPPPLKGRPGSQRPPPWGHLGRRTAGWIPLQNLARAKQEGVICLFECCSSAFTWFTTLIVSFERLWSLTYPLYKELIGNKLYH